MGRKPLIFLLAVPALLAVLSAAAWLLLNNESFLKHQLHAAVLRATGRALEVDGSLRLTLGTVATLTAENVRFSNAAWADEPDMAKVGELNLSLDLLSLFQEQTVIHELEFSRCQVQLIENEQGQKNWDFLPPWAEDDAERADESSRAPRVLWERVLVGDCNLSHDAPKRHHTLRAGITELSLQSQANGRYDVQLTGQLAAVPLILSGQLGPVRALWEGGPMEHDVELHVGDISLESSGSVADAVTGSGANISMQFSGPEFARVTDLLALPPFSSDAFNFTVKLDTQGDMTELDVNGDLGSFEIKASGELDRLLRPRAGNMKMAATGPDLEALGELLGVHNLVREPFNFELEAKFENGRASIAPAVLSTALDRFEVRGELGPLPGLFGSDLDISLHSDEIGRWADLLHRPVGTKGAVSATAHVSTDATGLLAGTAELQHLASSLKVNGSMGTMRELDQPDVDFEFASPNLAELAGLLVMKKLPAGASQASGHVRIGDGGTHFKSVVLTLADNHAQLDGTLTGNDRFAGSEFTVKADVPSTATLGVLFGYPDLPAQPLEISATIQPAGKGLAFQVTDGNLGQIKLSLKGVMEDVAMPGDVNADVEMQLPSAQLLAFLKPHWELPKLPLAFTGSVRHKAGTLQLQNVHLLLGHTTVDLDGQVVLSNTYEGTQLTLAGGGPDLGELIHSERLASWPGEFSFSAQWSIGSSSQGLDDAILQVGDMKAVLNGTVDRLPVPTHMALDVQLDVPDATRLNPIVGRSWPAQPLTARGRIDGSPQSFTLSNLSATHGKSQVSGKVEVRREDKPHISGTLHSDFLDLTTWLADQESSGAAGQKTSGSKSSESKQRRVFGDQEILQVGKHPFDLDMQISVDRADLGNTAVEDVRLGILLSDDQLKLDPLVGRDQLGSSIAGKFSLDGTGSVPQLDTTMTGTDLRFGFAALKGQDPSTYPPTEVAIDLHGTGATRHEMASSLNGKLRVFQGSGLIAAEGPKQLFSDFFGQLLDTLNPFSSHSKYTQLDCSVWAADIVNGQVKVEPIIVQTKDLTIVSSGTISLVTENLDLNFNTKARTGIGVSAGALIKPFVKVGGTLAAPALELDPAHAVIGGGTAVVTLGVSVLAKSLADRFLSSRDPCGDARKKLAERDQPNH